MLTPAGWAPLRAASLTLSLLAACSPGGPISSGSESAPPRATDPAAPVPTVILREADAGTPVVAEAGDHVEVRLAAETDDEWRFLGSAGGPVTFESSRLETVEGGGEGRTPVQVFRFATTEAGRSELRFARGDRTLTFIVDVR